MKLEKILKSLGLQNISNSSINISCIAEHTSDVYAGCLFISQTTTLQHFHEAVESGAVAILVPKDNPLLQHNKIAGISVPVIGVGDFINLKTQLLQTFYSTFKTISYIGVTGTNGKTTVTNWCADLLAIQQKAPGVIGTLGARIRNHTEYNGLTTPNQSKFYRIVDDMAKANVDTVVFEASSHALSQGRLEGLPVHIAAFTNLSQDHLDYHKSMIEYFTAKTKLFSDFPIKFAIVNLDDPVLNEYVNKLKLLGANIIGVSTNPSIKLPKGICALVAKDIKYETDKIICNVEYHENSSNESSIQIFTNIQLNASGEYNLSNGLVAAALCFASNSDLLSPLFGLSQLSPVPGRLEMVKQTPNSPKVFVDFAHTPIGLENVLSAIKPSVKGKLHVIFGCGGNRDKEKRPLMFKAVAKFADKIILTQDNSRYENPDDIFADTLSGNDAGVEVDVVYDRKQAISTTVANASIDDTVLIAGRGHETTHDLGETKFEYSDKEVVEEILIEMGKNEKVNK